MTLSTRPQGKDDEELMEDEDGQEGSSGKTATPAVSDRRRRRLLAKGMDPDAAPTTVNAEGKGRATPSRDENEQGRKVEGNFIVRWLANMRQYISDVRSELAKVAWPTREEVQRLTRIVLTVTLIAAIFLGIISFLFGLLTSAVAAPDTGLIAGIVTIATIIVTAGLWLFRDRIFPTYE
jgi:preprotein translocase SecE subunit